jgi:DNA repair and recombination protein RAD52
MSFNDTQIAALSAPLHLSHVKNREQGGKTLSYVEAWWAISEANRIFGYDAWTRETILLQETNRDLVELQGKSGPYKQWRVGYLAKVRVSVDGVVREGTGFGSGMSKPDALGDAIESAAKEAESDAMKRALMTFGNPFGLALYDKAQANVTNARQDAPAGLITGTQLQAQQAPSGRKSSAQAKRDGDHDRYTSEIDKLDEAGCIDWLTNFDTYTATAPIAWLDPLKNRIELRMEELKGAASVAEGEAELDAAFQGTMGSGGAAGMARRNGAGREAHA